MQDSDKGEVSIHGKTYLTVARRINDFRLNEKYEGWAIKTKVLKNLCSDELVVVKCEILNKENVVMSTGLAEENRNSSKINRTSALENCETSAVGRALSFIGLGGTEIASADEVANAISQQQGNAINQLVKSLITAHEHNAVGFVDWVESLEESQRQDFYGSGSQGEKMKFKSSWDELYKEGIEILSEYASQMSQFIQDLDSSGFNQLWDELTQNQRRKVWAQLSIESQTVAKNWREEAKQAPEKSPLEFISSIPTLKREVTNNG